MAIEVATKKSFLHYLFFWGGQQFSLLGSNVVQFVLIIWITRITASELFVSLASLVAFGPMVLLTPFAGVFADRWNRKLIIGITDTLQAFVTIGLLFIVQFYQSSLLALVFVLLGFRGVFQAFHSPTVTAILPSMVPRKHLSRMNSINYLTNSVVLMIGPALAALLLSLFENRYYLTMWIDVITWSIAIIPLFFIKIPSIEEIRQKTNQVQEDTSHPSPKPSYFNDLSQGFKFLKGTRGLFTFIIMATFLNFLLTPANTLLSPYVLLDNNRSLLFGGLLGLKTLVSNFHILPLGIFSIEMQGKLALVSALINAGVFASSLFLIFFKGIKKRIITWVMIFIYVELVGYALIGISPFRWFWMMGIGMFMLGLMLPLVNVTMVTILQISIPLEMQGRVMSFVMALATAIMPVGMILSGVIAENITTKLLMLITMGLAAVMTSLFWAFSDLKYAADAVEETFSSHELASEMITHLEENQETSER